MIVAGHVRCSTFVQYGELAETEKTLFIVAAFALTRLGNEAVVVFFVLSGFLVGGRALERIVEGTFKPFDYAVDRFVRIMLPLIPALVLTAIICKITGGNFNAACLIGNIFALQGVFFEPFGGNAPLWSLSYEVWFYTFAYAIGVMSIRKSQHFPSVVLLVLIGTIFTSLSVTYLFCWLIGAMAYIRMPYGSSWKIIFYSICLFIYSIIAIQIGSDSVSFPVEHFRKYFPSRDVSRIFLSLSISLIIQQILYMKPTIVYLKKLDHIGTALSAFSYTLYLTHYPILQLMTYLGLQKADNINFFSIGIFWGSILICFVVSWLFYLVFEKHTNYLKNQIKRLAILRISE
jgi:peptidoglycan/LPS O-acetylase OafA/YrhL